MMDAREITQENIELLSQQGFRLSLDDFGTGYSSLSYLHRLPITELKLDKSFVQDMEHSETARALTISVLSIAKSLGMTVVAEGVETSQQCRWLKEHGCEVMQGYLLGRPMPAHMLHAWSLEASAVCCS
jgi:EAL domain-containing protein (putative c-di-GMP-specific phosphodiesterase class I)